MANRLVCMCNFVDEKEIKQLLEKGADSTAQIQSLTRAGTSCGRCLPVIDDLVEQHSKTKPKPQQGKLRLGF
ncbi:(2Fe-2S)-binding protein [Draconibacterium sp. IB214405]|uniref:(2Fe-2S)-binding protein n=1 Tax=Draconibacterium sp. IB214405 TaxID=3097352 RepID=UPI002A0DCC9C|nr:(2Fe-2S)-binding protein [Draconibacterium sp. IB214405]MDX8340999.1 (2Fe-2S)-binding protein [Draconibacterium sp. IB214405]